MNNWWSILNIIINITFEDNNDLLKGKLTSKLEDGLSCWQFTKKNTC